MTGKAKGVDELNQSDRILFAAAISGAIVVAVGAFGAHGLKNLLIAYQREATFNTAVEYHMFHTTALLITGVVQRYLKRSLASVAIVFATGILVFSGSLYILSVTNYTWLGMITPFGGLLFIVGWLWLAFVFYKSATDSKK